MSNKIFVVSEWLAKENHEEELLAYFKKLMNLTLKNESGCIKACATKQVSHPATQGKSKYTIVLHQEYVNLDAFDLHCASEYVANAFKDLIENKKTAIVADWRCRLFSE